jgi:hypothetical protein
MEHRPGVAYYFVCFVAFGMLMTGLRFGFIYTADVAGAAGVIAVVLLTLVGLVSLLYFFERRA